MWQTFYKNGLQHSWEPILLTLTLSSAILKWKTNILSQFMATHCRITMEGVYFLLSFFFFVEVFCKVWTSLVPHCVGESVFKFITILLPQPPKRWNYICLALFLRNQVQSSFRIKITCFIYSLRNSYKIFNTI